MEQGLAWLGATVEWLLVTEAENKLHAICITFLLVIVWKKRQQFHILSAFSKIDIHKSPKFQK
jgi:hypothetical protein